MAEVNSTSWGTSVIPLYDLPTPWQLEVVAGIYIWLVFAHVTSFTKHLRALVQPFVLRRVESGVPVLLAIQKRRSRLFDIFLGGIATLVSVEFYSLVLPLLFWHGHPRLGRQLTLLMATGIYVGNCFKDTVCAPRPPSPVVRVLSSETEEKCSEEYGLPSSHTINIICFAGYVLRYLADQGMDPYLFALTASAFTVIASLVIYGRMYLGMHSPIDVAAGAGIGVALLTFWCIIDKQLDAFITCGENVVSFWACLTILALYAYPTPESPTPSFGDHTSFNGVAFGIVSGVRRTFSLFHSATAISLAPAHIGSKTAIGLVTIFAAKEGSKYLATIFFSFICNVLEPLVGLRFHSSAYVKSMRKVVQEDVKSDPVDAARFCAALNPFYQDDKSIDVDTGIRLVQYATLGWAVVELVPHIFSLLAL
jgi:sphingosine-1-phosphate phosphatase 1